ncbi:hypothetical protein DRH14_03160 [Candidatus Shapirobacteria bacterium]|nr:MAG: hypothetical protein DRH14_03160 [Candidatus Shapirobacteria bacterium]
MKLLIVYNNLKIGGVQVKIIDIINFINHQYPKIKITLLLRQKTGPLLKQIPKHITIFSPNINRHSYKLFFFPFYIALKLTQIKPNKILTFMDYSSTSTLIAQKIVFWQKKPLIISEDTSTIQNIQSQKTKFLRLLLIKLLYVSAKKILVMSKTHQKHLTKFINISPNKIVVTKNWLPIIFSQKINNKKQVRKTNHILFVGRLEPAKNLTQFIKIIKTVTRQIPNLKVKIVGNGSQLKTLKKLSKQLQLQNHIKFISETTSPQKYYLQSSLFLLSSNYEGFPLTILEATHTHCLPIVPNLKEITSYFNKYKKYLIFNSPKQATQQIYYLLTHPKLRQKLTNHYANQTNKEQFVNLHNTVKHIIFA